MTIWTLITFDPTNRHIQHIEHFSTRPADPRTFWSGDDIPRWELHEGDLNGGDTRKIDFNVPGHILDCFFDKDGR